MQTKEHVEKEILALGDSNPEKKEEKQQELIYLNYI